MNKDKCIDCVESKRCKESASSWIFFIIGLISTIAIRVVTVLVHVNPVYSKIAWHIGVGGFLLFFIYKFKVNTSRAKIINDSNLVNKIENKQLEDSDYDIISNILCSVSSRKERINYFFIFILSGAALLLAVYMDFFK